MATTTDRTSEIGRTISALRKGLGWSRDTLARKAGVGESTVSRLELYGTTPSLGVLSKIATALGVSASDLLAESEPERKP